MFKVLLFLWSFLFASFCGNNSSMLFMNKGLFLDYENIAIRSSYIYDSIFQCRYKNEFMETENPSYLKLNTSLAELDIDLYKSITLIGLVGTAKIELDEQFVAEGKICYGAGIKMLFWKYGPLSIAADGRYIRTRQPIHYILDGGNLFEVLSSLHYSYQEYQVSTLIALEVDCFYPYFGVSWSYGNLTPSPSIAILQVGDSATEASLNTVRNSREWGAILGISLFSEGKVNFTLENRLFSQYAIGASLNIRF